MEVLQEDEGNGQDDMESEGRSARSSNSDSIEELPMEALIGRYSTSPH